MRSVGAEEKGQAASASHRSLEGRVIIVTGAAGGIGRATCERAVALGARVVAVDIDAMAGVETVDRLTARGADAAFIRADVSDAEDAARYVASAASDFGRIDGLANCSGIEGAMIPVVDYPLDVFDRVLAVNLRGVFLGMKSALPVMIEGGGGAIVNVASVAGIVGHADHAAYVASKHGVVGLTRVAAAEVARLGIRVNAICPGPTTTRMMDSIEAQTSQGDSARKRREIVARIPAARYGEPAEVARSIAFLLSDDAAYVNGAILAVDGAFTAAI